MAKFNITVELDWCEDEDTLDESIKEEVIDSIAQKLAKNIYPDITKHKKEISDKVDTIISKRLNNYMEEFFTKTFDTTDEYGDVVATNENVKSKLKKACDNFLTEYVNSSGEPVKNSWQSDKMKRIDYIVKSVVNANMTCEINETVNKVVKEAKDEIKAIINKRMRVNLEKIVGTEVDSLVDNIDTK